MMITGLIPRRDVRPFSHKCSLLLLFSGTTRTRHKSRGFAVFWARSTLLPPTHTFCSFPSRFSFETVANILCRVEFTLPKSAHLELNTPLLTAHPTPRPSSLTLVTTQKKKKHGPRRGLIPFAPDYDQPDSNIVFILKNTSNASVSTVVNDLFTQQALQSWPEVVRLRPQLKQLTHTQNHAANHDAAHRIYRGN